MKPSGRSLHDVQNASVGIPYILFFEDLPTPRREDAYEKCSTGLLFFGELLGARGKDTGYRIYGVFFGLASWALGSGELELRSTKPQEQGKPSRDREKLLRFLAPSAGTSTYHHGMADRSSCDVGCYRACA